MKTIYLFLLLVILIFVASSCQQHFYAPNAHNVPLFQEKNEGVISAVTTTSITSVGFEAQGAYSLTSHIGIGGSFMNSGTIDINNSDYKFYEGGIGYFDTLSKHIVFECYGWVGMGRVNNNYGENRYIINSFYKYSIQPGIGIVGRICDVALSCRVAKVDMFNISYRNPQPQINSFDMDLQYKQLINSPSSFFFEPCLTFRVGWKNIKITNQFGFSEFIKFGKYTGGFNVESININGGIFITIGRKSKPGYTKIPFNESSK